MKIIKPSVEVISPSGSDGNAVLRHIERCGRVCYKSEGKIEEGSAEKFVSGIIKRGHESVLEHGVFRFQMEDVIALNLQNLIQEMECIWSGYTCYLRFTYDGRAVVSGNVRAWRDFLFAHMRDYSWVPEYMWWFLFENPVLFPEFQECKPDRISADQGKEIFMPLGVSDLQTPLEKLVHQDETVRFIADRGVSHEIVRHRPASYSQESTRYCNYSGDNFGGEITVIEPCFMKRGMKDWDLWTKACLTAENYYFELLDYGCSPQQARSVLPNSLKTEVVMTANLQEWRHFFDQRCAPAAHPQMREVAVPLLKAMVKKVPEIFFDQAEPMWDVKEELT